LSTIPSSTSGTRPDQQGGDGSTTEQAKQKAQETAQKAAGQARNRFSEQVDQRSTQAGEQVSSTASDVRSVAEQLREQGKDKPAQLAEQAADRAERLGDYLKNSNGDSILSDVEDFGRRQPWAVMFGGLAAGFLASRFLKASSSRRYEVRSSRLPATTPATTTRPPASTVPPPSTSGLGEPRPYGDGDVDPVGGVMPPQTTPPGGVR
jgi:hypothetical protein